ncbi:MAG: hypothetical protein J6T72_04255 [Alphaproteobacteria bacterium]|nr:hypothetical protein [Alphaproteobacteria bacterium]
MDDDYIKELTDEEIMTSSLLKTHSSKDGDHKKLENNKEDSSVFWVKEYDFEKRRDKIMACINALKGKSLPGAYLQSSSR